MSRSGKIEMDWADGHHAFRLGISELEELQEKTGTGPFEVLVRLARNTWRVADVREPLRLGLIGGGLGADKARTLVDRYAGPGQLLDAVAPAMAVLNAALAGPEDEQVGNGAAAKEVEETPAGSPSPPSTDPAS